MTTSVLHRPKGRNMHICFARTALRASTPQASCEEHVMKSRAWIGEAGDKSPDGLARSQVAWGLSSDVSGREPRALGSHPGRVHVGLVSGA